MYVRFLKGRKAAGTSWVHRDPVLWDTQTGSCSQPAAPTTVHRKFMRTGYVLLSLVRNMDINFQGIRQCWSSEDICV